METYITKREGEKFYLFKEDEKIGEISPEATWVKEEDEFDSNEIRNACYKGNMIVDQSGCSEEEWKEFTNREFPDINGFQICYMIKCPTCGHFH